MSLFGSALKENETKLRSYFSIQDALYGLSSSTMEAVKGMIMKGNWLKQKEEMAELVYYIICAVKSRTPLIEQYAKFIKILSDLSSDFRSLILRTVWRQIHHAQVQFLAAQLLDNGVLTVEYMIQRMQLNKELNLSPEVVFYFFPEFSTCPELMEKYIEPHKEQLAAWDRDYTAQCEAKLDGDELAQDNYKQFKDYRIRGINHNPASRSIRLDDVEMFKHLVTGGELTVNSDAPLSLFERNAYGKTKKLKLIEYAAFYGAANCFRWLLSEGADVTPRLAKFAAYSGKGEIIRACEEKACSFAGAMAWSIKGYHFSGFKYLREEKAYPVDYATFIEMCKGKYKGLYYLVWKGDDIERILMSNPNVSVDRESIDNMMLAFAAKANSPFLATAALRSSHLDVMKVIPMPHKTALHIAAVHNSLEVLDKLLGSARVDVNMVNGSDTPLMCAARENSYECVKALVRASGINVNFMSNDRTPLMIACEHGCVAATKALCVVSGIDVTNRTGMTAESFCKQAGADECLRCLTNCSK